MHMSNMYCMKLGVTGVGRVDRIEDSCPCLGSDEPGAKVCASFKLLIHVTKHRVLHAELDKYYEM